MAQNSSDKKPVFVGSPVRMERLSRVISKELGLELDHDALKRLGYRAERRINNPNTYYLVPGAVKWIENAPKVMAHIREHMGTKEGALLLLGTTKVSGLFAASCSLPPPLMLLLQLFSSPLLTASHSLALSADDDFMLLWVSAQEAHSHCCASHLHTNLAACVGCNPELPSNACWLVCSSLKLTTCPLHDAPGFQTKQTCLCPSSCTQETSCCSYVSSCT